MDGGHTFHSYPTLPSSLSPSLTPSPLPPFLPPRSAGTKYVLLPGMSLMYSWDHPMKNKTLLWQVQKAKKNPDVMKIEAKVNNNDVMCS